MLQTTSPPTQPDGKATQGVNVKKTVAIALLAISQAGVALAAQVRQNDKLPAWSKHTVAERTEFSRVAAESAQLSKSCGPNKCSAVGIRNCLDEVGKPPIPAAARNETIVDVTRMFLLMLNRR